MATEWETGDGHLSCSYLGKVTGLIGVVVVALSFPLFKPLGTATESNALLWKLLPDPFCWQLFLYQSFSEA